MEKLIETEKLQTFFLDYTDKSGETKQYKQESLSGEGLNHIDLPFCMDEFDADTYFKVKLYSKSEKAEVIDEEGFFRGIVSNDIKEEDQNKYKRSILYNVGDSYFKTKDGDSLYPNFPRINYQDVTERDMFGNDPIPATDLRSPNKGVWSMYGYRKFEIDVEELELDKEYSDSTIKASLYWIGIDDKDIDPEFEEEIRYNAKENKFIVYVDTNRLGELINTDEVKSKQPRVIGRFEVHCIYTDTKVAYSFPVEIVMQNTQRAIDDKGRDPLVEKSFVSIDFGTSSTCAAVKSKGKNRLFSLSGSLKQASNDDNAFENPTNLMIYDWDEIYKQWQKANVNYPFFTSKTEDMEAKLADYDSGYTVEDEYKDVNAEDGRRTMDAILTQLKMVPYWIEKGVEKKVIPYNSKDRVSVLITDKLEQNDDEKYELNPIAFYGYLLSRAINNPSNHDSKIYKSYQITYPVKFKQEVVEKIRASLEYGIKRGLPKPIRDGVDKKGNPLVTVKMVHSEPVACIGSIVGKQLPLQDGDEPKLFAIYDLGGGTMDFALGMFRQATEDEEDDNPYFIEIFHIDGDPSIGGEKLIHRISYEIYLQNRDLMAKKKIKFILPNDMLEPGGSLSSLVTKNGDEIAFTNVHILNEQLSRYLYKHGGYANSLTEIEGLNKQDTPDDSHYKLMLRDYDGEDAEVELEVRNIDEFIKDQIQETINAFADALEKGFAKDVVKAAMQEAGVSFDMDDVNIFLGGNASKQHYVAELMQEKFPENNIERIGEGQNKEDISDEYRVNEKTAVAFGQLNMSQYGVITDAITTSDGGAPFQFIVGYKDPGTDEFITVLEKSSPDTSWKKANRIDVDNMETDLYYTSNPNVVEESLIPLNEEVIAEDGKKILYIRIHKDDMIEYRVSKAKTPPSDDEEVDEAMVIKLN